MQHLPPRTPRLLFVPVSSPSGIGEYIRSLSIAQNIAKKIPSADIRFVLSEQAPYLADTPFSYFTCPNSPTKHSDLVKKYIDEFSPDIVVFDAAGRAEQLKHCRQKSIYTVYICQHRKKLTRALGLRRLRYTDEIWVVQPSFTVAPLSWWSKTKLTLAKTCQISVIGPIFHQLSEQYVNSVLKKYGLQSNAFILVNSGSGGHIVGGINAAEEFALAAQILIGDCDDKIVLINGPNFKGKAIEDSNMLIIPHTSTQEFAALLQSAKCALIAGGSALFQALVYGQKVVCCSVSKDQNERIEKCQALNLVKKSPLSASEMAALVRSTLKREEHSKSVAIEDGLKNATDKLTTKFRQMDLLQ